MNRKLVGKVALVALAIVGVVGSTAASCAKYTEPFKDAPRSGNDTGNPMDVIRMSDGFSNVGTSCDRYGNRVYVAYHGNNSYASIFVLKDGCR